MIDDDDDLGFPALMHHARLMAWLCLVGFVGFAMWLVLRP